MGSARCRSAAVSGPISDAQIYGLLWAAQTRTGAFSELHAPPLLVYAPDKRPIRLLGTSFDRMGLLGLGRRGLMRNAGHGVWEITHAGHSEIAKKSIAQRISQLADKTAADDREVQLSVQAERDLHK